MSKAIYIGELPPEVRKQIEKQVGRPRKQNLKINDIRSYAIKVLNVVSSLTPSERLRVLNHAIKANEV